MLILALNQIQSPPSSHFTLSLSSFSQNLSPTMATLSFSLLPKTLQIPPSSHKTSSTSHHHPTLSFLSHTSNFSSYKLNNTPSKTLSSSFKTSATNDNDYSAKRSNTNNNNNGEQRETIMLPGCDYNHWLIVMEFPKDPAPTREQMIDTYLNTLATVLGSMEEAKKNMYAFSTTTYTGFQCTVDEETSEKFKGLPGVLWVLPDSYIDVKNKDYGGDKYINGEIIPCKYPTYQPKQRSNSSKFESRRYERRRDGPPGTTRKPRQETAPSESASS